MQLSWICVFICMIIVLLYVNLPTALWIGLRYKTPLKVNYFLLEMFCFIAWLHRFYFESLASLRFSSSPLKEINYHWVILCSDILILIYNYYRSLILILFIQIFNFGWSYNLQLKFFDPLHFGNFLSHCRKYLLVNNFIVMEMHYYITHMCIFHLPWWCIIITSHPSSFLSLYDSSSFLFQA